MGYHVLPSIRDYWSSEPDLCVPFISNVMPLRRFEELRSLLHFNNNELMIARDDPSHDRAFKVQAVLNHFQSSFLAAMSSTRQQSIDEHMIKYKGHNILRQYVKGKPVQWGFKMWCRCDSKSGLLFDFDLYTGKKHNHTEHGLGEGVVLHLTEKIKGSDSQVYIDNFFNSPNLQQMLLKRKVYSAGTVRVNRKNMPKEGVPVDKEMERGDVACFRSGEINFVKWKDNKGVLMLSNFLSSQPFHEVKRKKKGSSNKEAARCPAVVKMYNDYMGGVGIMDQKKVTYQFDHRSKIKYYLGVVFDLIDIAVNNAFVVYSKLQEKSPSTDKLDARTYRRVIATTLVGKYTNRKRSIPSSAIMTAKKKKYSRISSDPVKHTMQKVEKRQRCKLCTSRKDQKRTNNMCV